MTRKRLRLGVQRLLTIDAVREKTNDETFKQEIVAATTGRELAELAAEWITSEDILERALAMGIMKVNERMRAREARETAE